MRSNRSLVAVSLVLLAAGAGVIEMRSYNNGLLFYDLQTRRPFLPPTVSVSRGRSLAAFKYSAKGSIWSTFGKPCECIQADALCGCCAGITVPKYNFDQKICANVTYFKPKDEIHLELILNESSTSKYGMSARNPSPFCIPLMLNIPLAMCVQMTNVGLVGDNLNMCMDFVVGVGATQMLEMHFQCMQVGLQGAQWVTSSGSPVIPANGPQIKHHKHNTKYSNQNDNDNDESDEYFDDEQFAPNNTDNHHHLHHHHNDANADHHYEDEIEMNNNGMESSMGSINNGLIKVNRTQIVMKIGPSESTTISANIINNENSDHNNENDGYNQLQMEMNPDIRNIPSVIKNMNDDGGDDVNENVNRVNNRDHNGSNNDINDVHQYNKTQMKNHLNDVDDENENRNENRNENELEMINNNEMNESNQPQYENNNHHDDNNNDNDHNNDELVIDSHRNRLKSEIERETAAAPQNIESSDKRNRDKYRSDAKLGLQNDKTRRRFSKLCVYSRQARNTAMSNVSRAKLRAARARPPQQQTS